MNTRQSSANPECKITDPKPFRSPLRYPGGKQKAIEQIALMLPKYAKSYREPMIGGGSVFCYAKGVGLAKEYWINDKFSELIAFWRSLQNQELCDRLVSDLQQLRRSFTSVDQARKFFEAARAEEPTDCYRKALLFFFFNRVTFSGTTRAGGFSAAASRSRFTDSSIRRLLPMPEALAGVKITELDFEDVITEAGRDVFIFLDPPYWQASRLYGRKGRLHQFDHERLATLLRMSDHKFLITYDDCEEIRRLYSWARVKEWRLQYGMNNCNQKRESKIGSELFIYNY